jgi:hypothetical protein
MRRLHFAVGRGSLVSILFLVGACSLACGGSTGGVDTPPGGDDTGGTGDDTGGGGDGVSGDSNDETTTADSASDDTGSVDTGMDATAGEGGIIPGCGMDTDGDGIIDTIEGKGKGPGGKDIDTDGDGTPDYLDLDSDNDGIPDKIEWFKGGCMTGPFEDLNDADGDGIPNFQDLDSDGNGYPDKDEACPPKGMPTGPIACTPNAPYDFDGDGVPDWIDFDNDHDSSAKDKTLGLADKTELSDSTGKYIGLVDTDADGIPDLYDRDSDNDFILDLDDGITDPDGDGKPNFRDTDSDGDTVSDWCEARANAKPTAADYDLALLDTDKDGIPDFLDKDTDGDLLVDGKEDKNNNCIVDSDETDRLKADTDGDGVGDLIEVALLGVPCAKDPACSPTKSGMFYFLEPYSKDGSAAPSPTSSKLALSTVLNKGDVGFIVDTTGSMGGEIANLKANLSTTIIPALKAKIPSLGVGIAAHDDVPYGGYGSPGCLGGDFPFYFTLTPQGYVTTVTADSQSAATALTTHCGSDASEAQVLAMYHAITGSGITWPGSSTPAVTPPAGTFGAMHFRSDALPIVINITDVSHHNGKRALDKTGTTYDTVYQDVYSFSTWNVDNVVTKMNAIGAHFIGVACDNGARLMGTYDPYGYHAYITDKTNSNVPPSSFTGGTCNTGVSGAAVAADGPTIGGVKQCRSVFSINTTGLGLGTSIVDGVVAVLNTIRFDVYVQAYNDVKETTDVVGNFMLKVQPDPTGGTDPVTGGVCVTFPATQLADNFTGPKALSGPADGVPDTIKQVNPGNLYCFNVTPKANTVIAATADPQTFVAWLKVVAVKPTGGTFALGADREVLFIVPPVLN